MPFQTESEADVKADQVGDDPILIRKHTKTTQESTETFTKSGNKVGYLCIPWRGSSLRSITE
jgi:hypothetical protein